MLLKKAKLILMCMPSLIYAQSDMLDSWDSLYMRHTWQSFMLHESVHDSLDFQNLDHGLLNAAVFFMSNREREEKGMQHFVFSAALRDMADQHAQAMAKHGFISHYNFRAWKFATPERRSKYFDANFAAENVASAFLLNYRSEERYIIKRPNGIPHFYRDKDHSEILRHTYLSFAMDLVRRWMESPPHRKNLLDPSLRRLGCAVRIGEGELEKEEIPLSYGAQNFGR